YGQPQYGQPQYGQPQYGQPQYGQPQYGQPDGQGWGPPPEGVPGWSQPVPPDKGRRRALIAASLAIVLLAGAAISYVALRNKNDSAGAASPQSAVKSLFTDLSKSDLLGVLDHLPPAERASLRDSFVDQVGQLKRLKVLRAQADPGKVSGIEVAAEGLTYKPNDEVINDHARIVSVTGGKVTINSDAHKIPFTQQFLDAAFPHGLPARPETHTTDIGAQVRQLGQPVRIAVQKVSGKWYPSLVYTVVSTIARDNGTPNPTPSDAIPATGAGSPEQAVRALVDASIKSDVPGVIGVLDPKEMAAVHDYGRQLLRRSAANGPSDVTIQDLQFTTTKVSGGVRVSLKKISLTSGGERVSVTVDGDCLQVESGGDSKRLCASELVDKYLAQRRSFTSEQRRALSDLFAALPKIGIVTTQSDGRWYVSPIRSYADVSTAVLGGLRDDDLLILVKLANK
ncbi:MAG: hypothetical protein M3140_05625, partial [Actinomycetota bacterium]|nr:hypothetical protein [Actinomycetota bacterium]